MRSWPIVTLRVFGALHVLMTALGATGIVWILVVDVPRIKAAGVNPAFPYRLEIYGLDTIVCVLCLVFLAKSGGALWRLERKGLWLSNAVLSFEVIWYLVGSGLSVGLLAGNRKLIGSSIVAASAIGEIAIAPQILTGYPVIAMVITNIAFRKLRKLAQDTP